jgi:23S rRNA (adenine2503-C2)-methyltransferase
VCQNDKKIADDDVKFKLAVSLHSGIDETVPNHAFSAKFPLADLRESLEYWYKKDQK